MGPLAQSQPSSHPSTESPPAAPDRVQAPLPDLRDDTPTASTPTPSSHSLPSDPSPPRDPSPPSEPPSATVIGGNSNFLILLNKMRPVRGLILLFIVNLVVAVLYCLFVYHVLIRGVVEVGNVYFDASTTNLLVSIFSQLWAIMCVANMVALFAALRPALALRAGGTSVATYVGLGASDWISICKVALANKLMNVWCDLRLGLPIMALAFGSVLKFKATFQPHFIAGNSSIPVYAGLTPIDMRVVNITSAADEAMYFATWSSGLLTNPRFARPFALPGCDNHCKSVMIPGGLELLRQVGPWLNQSVLRGGVMDDAQAIRVDNAPGFLLTFETLGGDFAFNRETDCFYAGQHVNNGLLVCVKQLGDSIAAGWAGCPIELYGNGSCNSGIDWAAAPVKWRTKLTAYKQFATTIYDRQDFSVVDIKSTSEPRLMPLSAADYMGVVNRILVPSNKSSADDISNINALLYSVTWMHRLYANSFPDDRNSIVANLHNFLAIPLQFSVTALQYVNYTIAKNPGAEILYGRFPLPDDMITTVVDGVLNLRLEILDWTGWLFIAGVAAVQLFVLLGILWVLCQERALPMSRGVQELDDLETSNSLICFPRQKGVAAPVRACGEGDRRPDAKTFTLMEIAEGRGIPTCSRGWPLARTLRYWRIALGEKTTAEMVNSPVSRDSFGSSQTVQAEKGGGG